MTETLPTTRLETLVDGVFAIVITLLVFDIRLPEIADTGLLDALTKLAPRVLSYVVSFLLLGLYWMAHHGQFSFITRVDYRLIVLNILLLLCICPVPFTTSILGRYGADPLAAAIFGCNLLLIGVMLYVHWRYASAGHRLVAPDLDPALIRAIGNRTLLGSVAYGAAIGLAFLSPWLSLAIYVGVPLGFVIAILSGRGVWARRTAATDSAISAGRAD